VVEKENDMTVNELIEKFKELQAEGLGDCKVFGGAWSAGNELDGNHFILDIDENEIYL
jgi:hypothetical protein